MIKVLFVCLGNICRSPLAHGILLNEINKRGLNGKIQVDSCGTSQYHIGEPPDSRTVENARQNGINLDHKARQFERSDFREFDYIVAMDNANRTNALRLDQTFEFSGKVLLMRDFDQGYEGTDVPDPYFGGEKGFQNVFDILNRSVNTFVDHLIEKHNL
ncbi:MAG: low molecular weight protein-tyrosine-phosphatase [Bacteroidota bacterium]